MAIRIENNSMTDLAPNTSNQIDDALCGKAESDTRCEFLTTSIPTTPQGKPTSSFSSHCSWGMGGGRGIRRVEGTKFTLLTSLDEALATSCRYTVRGMLMWSR